MIRSRADSRGFTLIELMIVVVIIGILAALAIPRFFGATTKTKQGEAKLILKHICTMQMTYCVESPTNDYYITGDVASADNPDAFAPLTVTIPGNARYSYTIEADGRDYIAKATADIDDDGFDDIWSINPTGELTCEQDDATN